MYSLFFFGCALFFGMCLDICLYFAYEKEVSHLCLITLLISAYQEKMNGIELCMTLICFISRCFAIGYAPYQPLLIACCFIIILRILKRRAYHNTLYPLTLLFIWISCSIGPFWPIMYTISTVCVNIFLYILFILTLKTGKARQSLIHSMI